MKTLLKFVEVPYFIFVFILSGLTIAVFMTAAVLYEAIYYLAKTHNVRYALWQVGIITDCPYCHGLLRQHGWEPNAQYTCLTEGCKFNEVKAG